MMVDFALEVERDQNLSPADAIYQACLVRFRPIMMTTLAAMFGAVPLAIGQGDGSEIRQPLGVAIIGGLTVSQMLTLYTTPIIYLYMDRLRQRRHEPAPLAELAPGVNLRMDFNLRATPLSRNRNSASYPSRALLL